MAKKPPPKPPPKPAAKKPAPKKELITPPKAKLISEEAKKLRQGDRAAGRILAEESVAVREGVRPSAKKEPPKKKP